MKNIWLLFALLRKYWYADVIHVERARARYLAMIRNLKGRQ